MVGMLLTGIFATKAVNSAGANGLAYGNPDFFFTQVKAMVCAVAYSFIVSYLIFKLINFIIPLRVSDVEEEKGLDLSQHDEKYMHISMSVTEGGLELEKI
jgi:Amt family ammonium transporter